MSPANAFTRRLLAAAVLVAVVVFVSGCAATKDTENASSRPWNSSPGYNGLPSTLTEGR